MTAYRRHRTPGATYFFTVALADRRSDLLVSRISELRHAFRAVQQERPFRCDAAVVLPDHLHMVWTLPDGDADFSTRWRLLKARFTRSVGIRTPRGASQASKGECGVWQRRFWEHRIRDDADFVAHVAYCWGNPVKHGLVARAPDWPHSSIHRDTGSIPLPAQWSPVMEGEFGEP